MTLSSETEEGRRRRERRLDALSEAVVPVAYFVLTAVFSARLWAFEANPDEGSNLAKAALVARGHGLYTEVASDQPPLLTMTLRAMWSVTGESVVASRLLVLASAALLLWAIARYARISWGRREAVAASLLILVVPPFQRLSVAVMVGLPSLAFAAVALALAAQWHASRRTGFAAASGACLALSMLTKLFTGPLLLILPAGIALARGTNSRRALLAWFGAFFVVGGLGFSLLAGPGAIESLLSPHWDAERVTRFREDPQFGFGSYLPVVVGLGLAAVGGAVLSFRRRRSLALYAAAWAVTSLVAVLFHRPLWFHHLLLWTVPASALAAPLLVEVVARISRFVQAPLETRPLLRKAALGVGIGAVVWLVAVVGRWRMPRGPGRNATEEELLVEQIRSLAKPGTVLWTDVPMFAFRAGLPVAPEFAGLSDKWLRVGRVTEGDLYASVERTLPPMVLLGRFELYGLRARVRQHHRLVYAARGRELYVPVEGRRTDERGAWKGALQMDRDWYAGPQARDLAEIVIATQHADGGWAKDEARMPGPFLGEARAACGDGHFGGCSTLDNGATTSELWLLAKVVRATGKSEYVAAFERGLEFLLATQQESGGWAQVPSAPLDDYRSAITFNDDAIAHVLELLNAVAEDPAFAFVAASQRARAAAAFSRGVNLLLMTQVRVRGELTGWCAQYSPTDLRPVAGRTFEPPSLSGDETVGVVRVLMAVPNPSSDVRDAIESAVHWLERVRRPDGPPWFWARFYRIGTNEPMFPDRDGTIHASLRQLSQERREGYRYSTSAPRKLLDEDLPRWRARVGESR